MRSPPGEVVVFSLALGLGPVWICAFLRRFVLLVAGSFASFRELLNQNWVQQRGQEARAS